MKHFLRRIVSYGLGAFVCIQLVYLPLSNFLQFVPRRPTPLPDEILSRHQLEGRSSPSQPVQITIDGIGHACDRWAEATAQNQGWSLFAPRFGEAGTFLSLEILDEKGMRTDLRSRFEPKDVEDFVRFDVLHYRLFYREMSFALVYSLWKPGAFETQGEEWRRAIQSYTTKFRRSMIAYIRWRMMEELPGVSAKEIAMQVRVFLPPPPSGPRIRPDRLTLPLARWKPDRPDELDAYNPVTRAFEH